MCAAWPLNPRDASESIYNQVTPKIDVNSLLNIKSFSCMGYSPYSSLQFYDPGSLANLSYILSDSWRRTSLIKLKCPLDAHLEPHPIFCRCQMTPSSTSDHIYPQQFHGTACAPRVLPGPVWPGNTCCSPRGHSGHMVCVTCRQWSAWTL
jgi:hypothetical protein